MLQFKVQIYVELTVAFVKTVKFISVAFFLLTGQLVFVCYRLSDSKNVRNCEQITGEICADIAEVHNLEQVRNRPHRISFSQKRFKFLQPCFKMEFDLQSGKCYLCSAVYLLACLSGFLTRYICMSYMNYVRRNSQWQSAQLGA